MTIADTHDAERDSFGHRGWHRWERVLLRASAACGALHVLDERVVRVPAGVHRGAELVPALVLIALAGALVPLSRVTRPAVLAILIAVVGAVFLGDGGSHVAHLVAGDAAELDSTGMVAAAAGMAMLMLAVCGAYRRGRSVPGVVRRWLDRVATAFAIVAVGLYLVAPVVAGTVQVHLPRRPVAPPPSAGFLPVSLRASDGPALQAWYHPSRNGAAVMVLNSARGDHVGSNAHAQLLADRGYGVLVYDARGTGGSEGAPNGWGWTWLPDVEAGIDYLVSRADVADGTVGLLGLSTGADVAIEVAARDPRVEVVVADGATAQGFADRPAGWESVVSLWPMYTTAQLLTGRGPAAALDDAIAAIGHRSVLLIASGSIPQEIPFNRRYDAAGGESVELWELPDVRHTDGLDERNDEYAARVLGLLDRELLGRTDQASRALTSRARSGNPMTK